MLKRHIIFLIIGLATLGCRHSIIRTESTVRLENPLQAKMLAEPVSVVGPLQPVVVQGSSCGQRVALIDVDGLLLNTPFVGPSSLGENPVALFHEKLEAAGGDPQVKAIVIRVNSPGGGVAACQTMRESLLKFKTRWKKPVIACILELGTGGAYYLASAADRIMATPASVVGGIGVILNLYNLRDLMAQFNILPQPIKAGEFIDLGTPAKALSAEEKTILQTMANEYHELMKTEILRSRSVIPSAGGQIFDGRIFTANQARERGLIDEIGGLPEAIDLACRVSGQECSFTSCEVVLYRRQNDPAHSIYSVSANIPLQGAGLLPSLPGLDRSKLPTFLSLWQPELTMEKLSGK